MKQFENVIKNRQRLNQDILGDFFSLQEGELMLNQQCINGTLYDVQVIQWYNKIATKNDGLLSPESCVWDPGSSLTDNPKNQYYDDDPADGGYNHFELKRYKRAYTLPGVFNAGDYAPPMREAARWIDNDFQDGNEL